uniref:Uncharacterized protein n=1 Tax=Arundo donax TaxID=35708 RepID=A0A0A8ZN23_ARUDO
MSNQDPVFFHYFCTVY